MSEPFEQQSLVDYLQARGRLDAKVSPDAAAKVKSLSKSTGVSEPVAQRNEGLLQEQEQAKQVQQLVETAPKVAKWLAKDGNFALAKDDLEALARIEQRSLERGRTAGDMITGAGASLLRMAPRAASSLSRSAWQGFSMAAASVESAAKGANDALVVSPDIRAMGLGFGASRPIESVARGLKDFGLAQSQYLRKEVLDSDLLSLPDELKGRLWDHPEYLLDPEWMLQNVGDAAGSMVPVVAAYMTGGPAAAGVVGGLMEAGDLYEDLERDPTVSTQDALTAAAGFGAVVGVLNEIGVGALVQKLPKGKLLSLAARIGQGLTEAGTEYAEEPAEAVARSLAHGRPEDLPGAVLESLKNVDVIPGSFLLGASGSVRRAVDLQQESDKAKRYADDQSKIGDLVKDSKLKQRSPEALAEVLEQTGFGEEAWITPEGVLALYGQADLSGQKGDELLQALGVDPKSAMSAMQLNQDIRVKTSDLHAHLTPEQFAELAQDLRSSPQAMTLRESGDEAMQARVREVAELAKREAQEEADYQTERDRLRQEVLDTGKVDPEQADAWLSTLDGFASRWAGNGRDRADMLKMIRAADSGVQAERSFHQPQTYFQASSLRGSLAVTDQGYLISLLQRADFSTVMHETGHFFLEEMGALIRSGQASESMVRDYELTRSWMATQAAGVLGELQAEVQQAKRAYNADKSEANRLALELAQAALDEVNGKGGEGYIQAVAGRHGEAATSESGRTVRLLLHERFARAFERYLLEGKAPSVELKGVFARFRRWLTNVYRNARALNVTLNADIRKVFDGLVQGEREVADAAQDSGLSDWSTDHLNALGVSGEDQAYVTRLLDTAKRKAEDRLHRAQVRGLRELRKQWRDETLHALESDALQLQVNELRKGRGLDNGAFIEMFGEEAAKGLPSGVLKKDGLDPEVWAYDNGYDSPDAAVNALWSWRSPKDLAAEAVEQREIEHRSQFRAEDFLVETDEYAAALEILSNYIQNGGPAGAQAQLEQRLQGKTGSRRSIARQAFRAYAKQVMGASSVADALRQDRYLSALRRAQDAERRAILRKDWAAAAKAGEQARFNLEMAGISGRMRQEVERGRRLVARTSRQKNLNSEPSRLVNEIARRFGLIAPAQGETLEQSVERYRSQWDTPVSLEDWTAAVSQEGYDAWFEPFVLDGRTQDYRKLSVDQFREVVDSVKQIKTVEHQRRTILTAAGRVALEQAEKELTDRALSTHKEKAPNQFKKTPVRDAFKGLLAIHTKMEALFSAMDGEDARGPWWTYMFRPLAEAESAKAKRMGQERDNLRTVFKQRFPSMKAMSKWAHKKFRIPEINDTLTGEQLHAIGLNMGNAYNREALKDGFGWNDAQLNAVLSKLEKADWEFIQSVWDYIDTFRPESFALEEEVTGRRPKRVEPEAVQTPFGEYAGGYYPIAFDPRLSFRAFAREQSEADKTLFGGRSYGSTQTRHGHLKERQGTGGQALRLEYAVIADHVFNTVHDLTFRRPVLEVGKLVRSKAVQEALESTVGREVHRELMPWLQDTAQERQEPMHAIHRAARWARKGTTVMSMGFKFTTMFSQVTGFLQTVETLGPKWSAIGLARVYGNPLRLPGVVREVFDKSPWMADRIRSYDRDMRDAMKGLKPVEGVKAEVQRMAFYGVGLFQMGVDLPTWIGAYEKAMAENGADEAASIAAADSAVRISQGSGQTKDLARVQRGGELMRLGTMFYSYYNTLYNLAYRRASRTKSILDTPRAAASALLLWILPSVLSEIVAGRGPDDDEDWSEWALPIVAQYPFQMIVGLRDIANAYFSGYGYEITPAQSAPASLIRWVKSVEKAYEEEDPTLFIEPGLVFAGYLFALPMNQAIITAGGVWDFMTGDPDAEVRDLFFRKRKGE